jgi:hypothetical protein
MIDYYSFFAFPIAGAFMMMEKSLLTKSIKYFLVFIFILLNLFQTWQYKNGFIHYDDMSRPAYFEGFFQTSKTSEWQDLLKPYNWKRRFASLPQVEYSASKIRTLDEKEEVYLRGFNQRYVSASEQSEFIATCYFNEVTSAEKFTIKQLGNELVAIKASNGKYLSVKPELHNVLIADAESITDNEKFLMQFPDEHDNKFMLQSMSKRYVAFADKFPNLLQAIAEKPVSNCYFRLFLLEDYQGR